MIVVSLPDGTARVKLENPNCWGAFADFERDDRQQTRVTLAPGAVRVIDLMGRRYVTITAPPGVVITVLED